MGVWYLNWKPLRLQVTTSKLCQRQRIHFRVQIIFYVDFAEKITAPDMIEEERLNLKTKEK